MKNRLIIVFLGLVILRLAPDWIARQGWKDLPPMLVVWILIFLVVLWCSFVEAYSYNQKVKAANKMIAEMKKRLSDLKKKKQ